MKSSGHPFQVRVSRVRSSDAARLARSADPLFDKSPDPAALAAYLTDNRNVFMLAEVNTTAVGFLRATALGQLHTRRPQMYLYEVGVARRWRRRGVGRALVEQLLQYCRRERFDEVFVFTDPANRAAVRLYRGTGAVTETPRDRMFVYRLMKSRRPDRRRATRLRGAQEGGQTG